MWHQDGADEALAGPADGRALGTLGDALAEDWEGEELISIEEHLEALLGPDGRHGHDGRVEARRDARPGIAVFLLPRGPAGANSDEFRLTKTRLNV